MTPLQAFITQLGTLLLVAALAGVLARRHYKRCWSFGVYLASVLIASLLFTLWPERFFRWDFWMFKENLLNLVKFALALELAFRTFRAFPGALATLRPVLLAVLVLTWLAVLAVPVAAPDAQQAYLSFMLEIHPRIQNGTIWLFTAIAGLIVWYRLPVDPFHKAILVSYVPYLLVFSVAIRAMGTLGFERGWVFNYASPMAYILLLSYWTYAAWRRLGEGPGSHEELGKPARGPGVLPEDRAPH